MKTDFPKTSEHGALAALKWALTRRPHRWPREVEQRVLGSVPACCAPDEKAAWVMVGHSTVLLQMPGANLLFDPIWSRRCSPFANLGPRRVRRPALAFDALPRIDTVLISHDHYDHCDRATLVQLAERDDPLFVTGRGVTRHLERWGIKRVQELELWQTVALRRDIEPVPSGALPSNGNLGVARGEAGLTATFLPARHFSGRGLSDRNRTLWGGFWIRSMASAERKTNADQKQADLRPADHGLGVYFCGDTGFDPTLFVEIRQRMGAPDLAFLPIGAYEPSWFMSAVHCNPEEAVEIHRILESTRSVGMHCGTFQLTDESIDDPRRRLVEAMKAKNLERFTPPRFGVRETLG